MPGLSKTAALSLIRELGDFGGCPKTNRLIEIRRVNDGS